MAVRNNGKTDMLFIHPEYHRQGYGKSLLTYMIEEQKLYLLDMNEQNTSAFLFYQKMGFKVIGLDETDCAGKLYPILHLKLKCI